jgi:hypothetical protein
MRSRIESFTFTLLFYLHQTQHKLQKHSVLYISNFLCSCSDWILGRPYNRTQRLEVACWPLVPKFAGSNPTKAVGFFGRKNPQHFFLQKGSKAVYPMSYFTACKRTQKWRGSRHFRQNFSAISRQYFNLPLLGSLASLQTLGASCGESWNALNLWFSSKLGIWRAAGNGTL